MIRTEVRLTPEQALALRHLAKKEGKSVAELIRLSVDAMLRTSKAIDHNAQRDKAVAAAGRLHFGTDDLSIEHDRCFVESLAETERELAG